MSEVVIEFVQNSSQVEDMRLFRGLQRTIPSHQFVQQPLTPNASVFAALASMSRPVAVNSAGDQLQQQLCSHADIQAELSALLGQNKAAADIALQIQWGADESDGLPWEALYDARSRLFLNMDSRWPISRMAMVGETTVTRGLDNGELKILAVLSAVRRNAEAQWDAIHQAAQTGAANYSTRVKVLYAEDSLKNYINQNRQSATVEFEPIIDESTVYSQIEQFHPHLIHLFGHGDNQGGPRIVFGTAADHQGGKSGSVEIEPAQILSTLQANELLCVWAINAMACLSARPDSSGNSFVRDLISAEVPVAIGMREKIDVTALNKFAEYWYDQFAQQLIQATQSSNPQQCSLLWRPMMLEGRMGILETMGQGKSTRVQGGYPEWSFPVLWESEALFVANVDTTVSDAARTDQEVERRFRQKCDELLS